MAEAKRFDVSVELEPTAADLRPEMTARVDIRVGERQDVLRLPVNAPFERDGMVMVNVLRGGQVETRQVKLGEQKRAVRRSRRWGCGGRPRSGCRWSGWR